MHARPLAASLGGLFSVAMHETLYATPRSI